MNIWEKESDGKIHRKNYIAKTSDHEWAIVK